MPDRVLDDVPRHALHGSGDVAELSLLLRRVEQTEEGAGLTVVVVAVAVVMA